MSIKSDFFSKILSNFILKNNIVPFSISFVFSFNQDEIPDILIGIAQCKEIDYWIDLYEDNLKYYAWNSAEYEIFEKDELSIDMSKWSNANSRNEHINLMMKLIPNIKSDIKKITGYEPYLFAHDLDDDDLEHFMTRSLTNEEIKELKIKKAL